MRCIRLSSRLADLRRMLYASQQYVWGGGRQGWERVGATVARGPTSKCYPSARCAVPHAVGSAPQERHPRPPHLELAVVLAVLAAHGVHHLLAQLHGRWEGLGVTTCRWEAERCGGESAVAHTIIRACQAASVCTTLPARNGMRPPRMYPKSMWNRRPSVVSMRLSRWRSPTPSSHVITQYLTRWGARGDAWAVACRMVSRQQRPPSSPKPPLL